MLSKESINAFFMDSAGNEVLITKEVTPCCSMKHYLGNILGTSNVFCYDSLGRRLDHKLKVVPDLHLHLNLEY
jgi:hypothetical protein